MKKKILITLGDPAGIGPEIILKSLKNNWIRNEIIPICIGDEISIRKCIDSIDLNYKIRYRNFYEDILTSCTSDDVHFLSIKSNQESSSIIYGIPDKRSGEIAVESVLAACKILKKHRDLPLITAPLSKKAIQKGKYHYYKGHVEIFIDQFSINAQRDIKNMLITDSFSTHPLRIINVTSHIPLRQVSDVLLSKIGIKKVTDTINMAFIGLKKLGIENPKIVVTGLNPHIEEWGEKQIRGELGKEEIETVIPAIEKMKGYGIQVDGPLPADTAFRLSRLGYYDGVVSMFHDQSHIATNSFPDNFEKTVIFTVGTPFTRMSTSHGLAANIAGQFIANTKPIENCIKMILHLTKPS